MSGSCAKLNRSRKRPSNMAYKSANRHLSNKEKNIARDKRIKAMKRWKKDQRSQDGKPERGAARAARRVGLSRS